MQAAIILLVAVALSCTPYRQTAYSSAQVRDKFYPTECDSVFRSKFDTTRYVKLADDGKYYIIKP